MPPGSLVTQCEAVDPDSVAAPGEVALTYAITHGNEDGVFEIEATTGVIRILFGLIPIPETCIPLMWKLLT